MQKFSGKHQQAESFDILRELYIINKWNVPQECKIVQHIKFNQCNTYINRLRDKNDMIAQYTIFSQCNIVILHLLYIILKLEGKNDIILMDVEKAFDTVQHSFLTNIT